MKLLLLFAFYIFSAHTFAQLPKKTNPYMFQLPDTLKKFKGNENTLQELKDYLQKKKFQNNSLAVEQGRIVLLPQDHMPCVVPNTSGIVPIPNAWNGVTVPYSSPYHPIPNPALPKIWSFKWNALDNGLGIPAK